MTSYHLFYALAAQREDEIERQAELARRAHAQVAAPSTPAPRHRRLGLHRRRHVRLV